MSKSWRSLHERQAWEWAFSTNLEQVSFDNLKQAYRVMYSPCKPDTCKVNCKWNPNCLNGLGESLWFNTPPEKFKSWELVKQNGGYCGLKNLGATCYVSSLLQVWFSDFKLRKAVLSYVGTLEEDQVTTNSDEEPTKTKKMKLDFESQNSGSLEASYVERPQASISTMNMALVIDQLQMVFLMLLKSKRKVIDPTRFVDSLNLQHDRQQDAQEFRKLFLSQLNDVFKTQSNPLLHTCVDDLFQGSYSYVTKCEACGGVSEVDSQFYELELSVQDCPTLASSLAQFFKQENLDDENQYYCSHCSRKQDAKRYIQLKSLPPVLTLQMLRFVFNMGLLAKVKVASYLIFPDQLDLSPYLGQPTPLYHLSSFIIHTGPSAYSGHYIAYVKDHNTGKWWTFDDDVVEEYRKEKLIVCSDEDCFLSGVPSQKKPRCPKHCHMSNNVYMFVYKREDHIRDGIPDPVVPLHLQQLVDADNASFMSTITEMQSAECAVRSAEESKAAEMRTLYAGLAVKTDSNHFQMVPTFWIKQWLIGSLSTEERTTIDSLLCPHKKLSVNAVADVKRVSCIGLDAICEKLKKSVHPVKISSDMLCEDCVRHRCEELQLKHKMNEDNKIITKLTKSKCTSASGFWVGKKSLQSWKKIRHQQFESYSGDISSQVLDEIRTDNEKSPEAKSGDSSDHPKLTFNVDLLCEHGKLCLGEAKRKLVSTEVWAILHQYFPTAKPYPALHTVCQQCLGKKNEAEKARESLKSLCRLQKEKLSDLYYLKNRPQLSNLQGTVFAVPRTFVDLWTSFIRFPNTYEMPMSLCIDLLLCSHGRLCIPLQEDKWEKVQHHIVLLHSEEWQTLLQWYTSQESVTLYVEVKENSSCLKTIPDFCEECCSQWNPDEDVKDNTNLLYLCFVENNEDEEQALLTLSMFQSSNKISRKRKPPGAHKIEIDLSQTLFHLQLAVMNEYGISPRDQLLYFVGKPLIDSEKSLRELGVESGAVIVIKTLSEEERLETFLKEAATTSVEDGFKGPVLSKF